MPTNEAPGFSGFKIGTASILGKMPDLGGALNSPSLASPVAADSALANYRQELPDMRPRWHQLIVIGNGFDLECGLPSSFGSFIEERNRQFLNDNPIFRKTMWDVILAGKSGEGWCDIENAIAEWVSPKGMPPLSASSSFGRCLGILRNWHRQEARIFDPSTPEDAVAEYLWQKYGEGETDWSQNHLLSITGQELHTLEKDFSVYLSDAVGKCSDYKDRVSRLMIQMMVYERPNKDDYDIEDSILSFNYTHDVDRFESEEHQASYVNIHGRLGGEIVFGIDGTDRIDDGTVLPLTKTYRLMSLDLPDRETLIHSPGQGLSRDLGTMAIKFYGHSLGEADYSYFQAIFDGLKLYEGNTRLIFFFRSHSGGKDANSINDAREEMMGKAICLLSAYGATLENKDHGKNLVHKLLIEGRLSVTLLPNSVRRASSLS